MENDSSTLMHHLNLQKLAKKMFESRLNYLHWLSGNYLLKHTQSSPRSFSKFSTGIIRRVFYGSESIFFIGLKIWDVVSVEFKELCPLSLFKKVIKNDSLMSSHAYRLTIFVESVSSQELHEIVLSFFRGKKKKIDL